MDLTYLYQLQDVNFSYLQSLSARISVIDMDDAGLTANQIDELQGRDQVLLTYLSIGEAEDYRDYWIDGNWGQNPPDFLLRENPEWEGNYLVKFWDEDWQKVILDRVHKAVQLGYDGLYLDIVDAYTVRQVKVAYDGSDIRQEMLDFVIDISNYARGLDPDFLIVPQNAVELLAQSENDPDKPNKAYLDAIDGVGVEDLWYDDNSVADWTPWDLEYIRLAQSADKFVLATSYPTTSPKQQSFVEKALAEGFVPFVGTRDLDRTIPGINFDIPERIGDTDLNLPDRDTPKEPPQQPPQEPPQDPSDAPDGVTRIGGGGSNVLKGSGKDDLLDGKGGNDELFGYRGDDVLKGGDGEDSLYGGGDDDALFGESGNDILKGGNGDDTIVGASGRDILLGGAGNDRLVFDEIDRKLAGGKGIDTLAAEGEFDFDISDSVFRSGFERLDLDNGKSNQVTIKSSAILRKAGMETLFVTGDGKDNILCDMGPARAFAEVDGTSYGVFQSRGAELFVEIGVAVNGDILDWV